MSEATDASRGLGPESAVLALDLGASRIRAGVVDRDGSVVARADGDTPALAGPDAVVEASVALLEQVRSTATPAVRRRIGGLGISAPGPVDPRNGRLVEPPNLGPAFRDVPIAEPLGKALGLPVALERDTNVAALAERDFGAAQGCTEFLYLTVSTGIGGGIVAGSRLFGGADGAAGELGHILVELDGPPCGCGGRGHLEAFSSGVGIARAAAEAVAAGATGLTRLVAAAGRALTARDVAIAEENGDADAAAIMERARVAFAEALVGLVDVFNPEAIVVGGSLARNQGERWLAPARDRVRRHAFRIPRERVRIVAAALGDDVGLVGALPLLRGHGGGSVSPSGP